LRSRIDPDADLPAAVIPAAVLNEVFAHAREEEPEECCGLITGDERVRHRRVVRCRNDMTLHHRRDPAAYPRGGGEAFHMNEQDYRAAEHEADARGEKITCVYHSHVGCDAYFSELDQEFAEQPAFPFPEADHLVVSVSGGQVLGRALFQRRPAGPADSDPRPAFVGRAVVHGSA